MNRVSGWLADCRDWCTEAQESLFAAELVLTLILAAGLVVVLGLWPLPFIHWNVEQLKAVAERTFFCCTKPEPMERAIYIVGVALLSPALVVSVWIVKRSSLGTRIVRKAWLRFLLPVGAFLGIASILIRGVRADENFLALTAAARIPTAYWIFTCAWTGLFLWRLKGKRRHALERLFCGFFSALAFASLLITALWALYPLQFIDDGQGFIFHLEAVLYSVTQVWNGKALLTGDFVNTYGLYPHFLMPIFKLIGFSLVKFTACMSLLMAASLAFLWWVFKRTISHPEIRAMSFLFITAVTYISMKIVSQDHYFAYHPLRLVFPAAVLYVAVRYASRQSWSLFWMGSLSSSIAVLWQPDSGLAAAISWLGLLVYMALENLASQRWADALKAAARIGVALFSAIFVGWLFKEAVRITYGVEPKLELLFSTIGQFANLGYFMLPMPPVHPWNGVILIYMVGLAYSIFALFNPDRFDAPTARVLFFAVSLGFGLFLYYQGRSNDALLVPSCWPAALVAGIFADRMTGSLRKSGTRCLPVTLGFIPISLFLTTGTLTLFSYGSLPLAMPWSQILAFSRDIHTTSVGRDLAFVVESRPDKGEEILILSGHQAVFHAETGLRSAFDPGIMDIITKDGMAKLIHFLEQGHASAVFLKYPFGTAGANIQTVSRWQSFESILLASGYVHRKTSEDGMAFWELESKTRGPGHLDPDASP
jgi:hypothetical protein